MSRSRQLAAIMFTDIKGYTALMQQDEQQAIEVRNRHRQIFNSVTEQHRGRILQYYGDGTLSIFDSAIDAVLCGIELQRGFQSDPAIPVRVGIHTGDIVFSEEEIIGDSVNVASRIESLAVAGSVLISAKVHDEIKNQRNIQTVWLKDVLFKNVARPMAVYALTNEGLVVPAADALEGKTQAPPSVSEEQPSEAPPPAAPPLILATKLYAPPVRPELVSRPRLVQRLQAGLGGKLTVISAPAGFGKTTLVSEWLATTDRTIAWLSLDKEDSHTHRFLSYLLAAVKSAAPALGNGTAGLLQSGMNPSMEVFMGTLLNELVQLTDPLLLVLDDYHLIDEPAINQGLSFLIDHLPPQLHLVIATREDPSLPLSRLRVRRQLTELRAADLRFTNEEAASFLNNMMGLQLSIQTVAALEQRTEGWIAGLQMAALSLQGRQDTDSFIEAFTGSHRFVLDYLLEEVLAGLPEDTRNFLLETAILDQLTGPLCDAVTDASGGKETLETLERENIFVIPLDDQRAWYRYHHLFGEVLRVRAQELAPADTKERHRRAAVWFDQNNRPAEAIRHALTSEDFEWSAQLIERIWPAMDQTFQTSRWLQWMKELPAAIVEVRPIMHLGHAWALINQGNLSGGEAQLDKAEIAWDDQERQIIDDESQARTVVASIATARGYTAQARGDSQGAIDASRRALEALPETEYFRRGAAAGLLGCSYWANGDLQAAYDSMEECKALLMQGDQFFAALTTTLGLADIRFTQGRLQEAKVAFEQALALMPQQQREMVSEPFSADMYLGISNKLREQGAFQQASEFLEKSRRAGQQMALPDWHYRYHLAQALECEALGNFDDALANLNEAERLFIQTPLPNVRPVGAQRARLFLRHGQVGRAVEWAQNQGLTIEDELNFLKEYEHLTLARIRLTKGEAAEIISFLDRLLIAAEAGGRIASVIDIHIVRGLAYQTLQEKEAGLDALKKALSLAAPQQYVRPFLEAGTQLQALLASAEVQKAEPEFVSYLLSHLTSPTPSANQQLIEPLSEREIEVLQLIANGLSNQDISQRLFLSLSTIKGHNQNIFGKLMVKRRTEAVARARELGLIN